MGGVSLLERGRGAPADEPSRRETVIQKTRQPRLQLPKKTTFHLGRACDASQRRNGIRLRSSCLCVSGVMCHLCVLISGKRDVGPS